MSGTLSEGIDTTPDIMGVVYEDDLPLSWERLADEPGESALVRTATANEELLRTLAVLEELPAQSSDEEGPGMEFQRLEAKVNLLMDLVGQLYAQSLSLPDARRTRLAGNALAWVGQDGLVEGDYVKASVYLSHRYPRPLVLFGRIKFIELDGEKLTALMLGALPDTLQQQLDRFIFRQHRRLIAHRRRTADATAQR